MTILDQLRYPEAEARREVREITRQRIRREEEDQEILTEYEAKQEEGELEL